MADVPTVYLAGPYGWRDDVEETADADVEWVSPFDLHDVDDRDEAHANAERVYERDMAAVEDADAVYVHLDDEYVAGAAMEAERAAASDVPVVVRDARESDERVPLMLGAVAETVAADRESAVEAVVAAADRATDRIVDQCDARTGDDATDGGTERERAGNGEGGRD